MRPASCIVELVVVAVAVALEGVLPTGESTRPRK